MIKLILLLLIVPMLSVGQTYEVIDRNAGSSTYGQRSRYEVRDNSQLGSFDYSTNVEEYDHNAAVDEAIERGYNQGNSYNNRSNRNTYNNNSLVVLTEQEVIGIYNDYLHPFKENGEYERVVLFLKNCLNTLNLSVKHQNEFKSIIPIFAFEYDNYEDFCKYSMYMTQDKRNEYSKRLEDYCNGSRVNKEKLNKEEFNSKKSEINKTWNKAVKYIKEKMPTAARIELDNVSRLLNKITDNSLSMNWKLERFEGLAQGYYRIGDYEESVFWLKIANSKSGKNTFPWIGINYYLLHSRDSLKTQLKECCNNLKKGFQMGYQNIGLSGNKTSLASKPLDFEKYLENHKALYKENCESNLNLLSRQDAIKKLKEAKELLDIEMMTRKEFDKLKEELGPIIKGVPVQKQNKRNSNSLQTSKPLKKKNTTKRNSTSDKKKTYSSWEKEALKALEALEELKE